MGVLLQNQVKQKQNGDEQLDGEGNKHQDQIVRRAGRCKRIIGRSSLGWWQKCKGLTGGV